MVSQIPFLMSTPFPLATSVKVLLLAAGTVATANAQSSVLYQAPTGPNGTWNLYEYVLTPTTFKAANTASNGITHPLAGAVPGYLTDIQNDFENTVVNQMTYRGDAWIGLTDRFGAAPNAMEGQFAWTSGATYDFNVFNRWNTGEPNNAGEEDATHITGAGFWNDNKSGYGIDDPVVDPNFGSGNETAVANFRYIRKWATQSATPLPGVRSAAALSFPGTLASLAPASTNGAFGVRELRTLNPAGNVYDALTRAIAGNVATFNGQMPTLNVADPDTNANGGPILAAPAHPYLSQEPGVDDNNIITIANGKVVVPSSGEWTIQVKGDDGFALRVVGQQFTSVNGAGQIDPLDPSTMYFYGPTGDADTRGVLTLAAGTYDVEFLHFEAAGGAFYEVTTAKGAVQTTTGVQWLAMGDGSVLPAPALQPVRLTQDLVVRTSAERDGLTANTIEEARALITYANDFSVLNTGVSGITRVGDGQANPLPTGTPADQFAMQFLGKFLLDDGNGVPNEPITLTFGIFSDDGSQLRIIGQDFTAVSDFEPTFDATLVDVEGDMALTADFLTGNTNSFGLITLTEGQYDFEALMFEEGGGANLSILYSFGDKLATGLDDTFQPLTKVIAGNEGWAVVPEPSTAMLGIIGTSLLALRRRRR